MSSGEDQMAWTELLRDPAIVTGDALGGLRLLEPATGQTTATHRLTASEITDLAVGPERGLLVSGSSNGPVQLLNVRRGSTRNVTKYTPEPFISSMAWAVALSPCERLLAIGEQGDDIQLGGPLGGVQLHDLERGEPIPVGWHRSCPVDRVVWSPDGRYLAAVIDDLVCVYNRRNDQLEATHELPLQAGAQAVTFTGTAAELVVGDETAVAIWDACSGRLLRRHPACPAAIRAGPEGEGLVIVTRDGQMGWFDPSTGSARMIARVGAVKDLLVVDRPARIVLLGADDELRAFDPDTGHLLWRQAPPSAKITAMEFWSGLR